MGVGDVSGGGAREADGDGLRHYAEGPPAQQKFPHDKRLLAVAGLLQRPRSSSAGTVWPPGHQGKGVVAVQMAEALLLLLLLL